VPWQYEGRDIEVIVDPDFQGDIIKLAKVRSVWIVDTQQNRPKIDEAWQVGGSIHLFEVSRVRIENPDDRIGNLWEILGNLDDHRGAYDFVAHGLEPTEELRRALADEGFRIGATTQDGFAAYRIPGVREQLLGRSPAS
jgi:hypothetical protein